MRSLKGCSSPCINEEQHKTIAMLTEVEAFTFAVFESLLSLILGPKSQSKLNGWSLVSKLVQPKRVACDDDQEEESDVNDF
ncbi:hypothetical protein Ddye_004264 [Dipteronia dyeriana]|uniref:Uncharacterized protein n=1 Tax=Dipteronia dyeriana TaxID=168575 RepID=A0AAD9XUK5_9ROSI|nr:hypothetical protein Ddye_004264 [Dipteronia dyeriana]